MTSLSPCWTSVSSYKPSITATGSGPSGRPKLRVRLTQQVRLTLRVTQKLLGILSRVQRQGPGEPETWSRLDQETGQGWKADPSGVSAPHGQQPMPVLWKNWAYCQGVFENIGHHSPSPHHCHRITGVFHGGGEKRLSSLQTPTPPGDCISSVCAQTIITLNASITTPNALIIPVTTETIPDTPLMSLVDLGSLDSFIDSGFMEKHHLAAYTIPAIRLCLIDSTCNSVITQAIKLHIHFSSGKKQTVNFYLTPLDSSCTLMLGHHWLAHYNPSIDWVKGSIDFHIDGNLSITSNPNTTAGSGC